jgi:hypothetical protein
MMGELATSLPVWGVGATMMGEDATSLPVWGVGATMMGEDATSLPVWGVGATMMGEDAMAATELVIRAETRTADLTFNEIEVIGVLLPKKKLCTKIVP